MLAPGVASPLPPCKSDPGVSVFADATAQYLLDVPQPFRAVIASLSDGSSFASNLWEQAIFTSKFGSTLECEGVEAHHQKTLLNAQVFDLG